MNIYNDNKSEYELVKLLSEKKITIAVCESCTGGLISERITSVPGASDVFGYGVCTYANEAKVKLLNVNPETLERFGAVSQQTAIEMARGMLTLSEADIAISTTGIAGPGGGSPEKPVGLVYTAICTKIGYEKCKKLMLGSIENPDRNNIRFAASCEAISLALEFLEK